MTDYTPSDPFLPMATKNVAYSLAGVLAGVVVNQIGKRIYTSLNITDRHVKILGQIILCAFFIAYIHTQVDNKFGWDFQNVTPGLFFTAFFFGVQYVSFTAIQDIYGISRL
jgi:hypothetical protein